MGYPMGLIHSCKGGHHDLGIPHGSKPPPQEGVTMTLGYPMCSIHPHKLGVTITLGYPIRPTHPPNVGSP